MKERPDVVQTIACMSKVVGVLESLSKEVLPHNKYRAAIMMEGPLDMMLDLCRDLEWALGMEHRNNDE